MEMTLGNRPLTTPSTRPKRISMMLWGPSGCGKTTLASTAPGKKLWISFDPDGTDSLINRSDIIVLDLANEKDAIVEKFKVENPMSLAGFLDENTDIETIVFDSITTFGDKALRHGVVKATTTSKGKYSTLEDPGYSGYGNKNTWTRTAIKHLLRVTGEANRHLIIIAHEDKPVLNADGHAISTTIMIGSSLAQQVPIDFSEVWHMEDTGKIRRIAIRPCRLFKPMKTRMFATSGKPEFEWKYDPEEFDGDTISNWYSSWIENKGKKIELP
mgnify:CR=1 FL=1